MAPDLHWNEALAQDVRFGYLSGEAQGPRQHHPRVVIHSMDSSVLRVLREELKRMKLHFTRDIPASLYDYFHPVVTELD